MRVKYIDYERSFGIRACQECELKDTCLSAVPKDTNGAPVYYNRRLWRHTRCGRLLATGIRFYKRAIMWETERLAAPLTKRERRNTEKYIIFCENTCARMQRRYNRFVP